MPPRYDISQLPQRNAYQALPSQPPSRLSQTRTAIITNGISEEQASNIPLILYYAQPIRYGEGDGVTFKDVMQTTTLKRCQSVDDFLSGFPKALVTERVLSLRELP